MADEPIVRDAGRQDEVTSWETVETYPASAPYGAAVPVVMRRISWGAVLAGVVIVLVTHLTLSLLGAGIGFGTIDPATEENPFAGLATGAGLWWAATTLIALFLGGWVAGRLAGSPRGIDGFLHGILTWGVASLVTVYLVATSVGNVLSGTAGLISETLSQAGQGVGAVVPEAARTMKDEPGEQTAPRVDDQAADTAAHTLGRVALWAFAAMILGAIAAGIGGRVGTPRKPPLA